MAELLWLREKDTGIAHCWCSKEYTLCGGADHYCDTYKRCEFELPTAGYCTDCIRVLEQAVFNYQHHVKPVDEEADRG